MVSQEFFVDIILPAELMPLIDSSYKINEYQEYFVGRLRRSARRADNLTTSMRRLSWNLGSSTSRKPQNLYRTVQGLFYVLLCYIINQPISRNVSKKSCPY